MMAAVRRRPRLISERLDSRRLLTSVGFMEHAVHSATDHRLAENSYRGLEVADLDNDQDPDIIVGNVWYQNVDSRGSYQPRTLDLAGATGRIAPVDVDTDGDLDIVSTTAGGVARLENDGAGNFTPLQDLVTGLNRGAPRRLAAGDFDGDGDIDLALDHTENHIQVHYNQGMEFLSSQVLDGQPGNDGIEHIKAVDLASHRPLSRTWSPGTSTVTIWM